MRVAWGYGMRLRAGTRLKCLWMSRPGAWRLCSIAIFLRVACFLCPVCLELRAFLITVIKRNQAQTSNRRWACETWAKSGLFFLLFSLLFCIPRLGQVRDLQSGTPNSAEKSLFAVSGVLASLLGNFARGAPGSGRPRKRDAPGSPGVGHTPGIAPGRAPGVG